MAMVGMVKSKKLLLGLVALGFFIAGIASAQVLGSGTIRSFNSASASDFVSTTSTTFTDMPGMTVTFAIPVGGESVVIMFSGEFPTDLPFTPCDTGANFAFVQLVIDGVIHSGPDGVGLHSADYSSNGFNFISGPLAAGTHTAKIQWRTTAPFAGCALNRSMIILHR